ncbi:MAG: PQQ-binding-like beta-propeller repeat protein [Acidimicrobiales bacterium]
MSDLDRTWYDVLGVDRFADAATIHRAYRRRAMLAHPDRGGSEQAFVEISAAYEVLSDPDRRRDYDAELAGPQVTHRRRWATEPREDTGLADVLWHLPEPTRTPPVATGGLLITSPPGAVAAVDGRTGRERWRAGLGRSAGARPGADADVVAAWTDDGTVHGFDTATGERRWHHRLEEPTGFGLACGRGLVVCARSDHRLDAFDAQSGRRRWHARLTAPPTTAPVVVGAVDPRARGERGAGTVVVFGGDRVVHAFDTARGHRRWRQRISGLVDHPPVVVGGVIWFAALDGSVQAMEAGTGAHLARATAGDTATGIVVGDDAVHVTVLDDVGPALRCLRLPDLEPDWRVGFDDLPAPPVRAGSWLTLVLPTGDLATIEAHHGVLVQTSELPSPPSTAAPLALPADGVGAEPIAYTDAGSALWAVRQPR